MVEQENTVAEEETRLCKKCEKRLPNKSYFCMYCGTDNSPTSIQVEYEKANNESLKKYTMLEHKQKTIPWYILFMLLVIDVIVINVLLFLNHDDIYIKVNSARFENYEKTYYVAQDAYLAVKDNQIRMIGSNRMSYLDTVSDIQQYEFKDIQEVYDSFDNKTIYFQTSSNKLYKFTGSTVKKIKTEEEYIDIYHYLNDMNNNCYNSTEHIVLEPGAYYYDPDNSEIIQIGDSNYVNNGTKLCKDYTRVTVIDNNELALENPEIVYQSVNGNEIILKNKEEMIIINSGQIKERIKELKVNDKTVKISETKEIFYKSDNKLLVIDINDDIYNINLTMTTPEDNEETTLINQDTEEINLEKMNKDTKIDLIILLVLLLGDIVFLYKLSDKGTFTKCISMAGLLMIEYILFTVFRGSGFELDSSSDFLNLLKLLALNFILIIIISTVIVQMSELVVKVLDLVKFRNIITYVFTLVAVAATFINVFNSGTYGAFFAIFLLGSYWSYFTETEDIDIDMFITPSSYIPILVLSAFNILLYFALLYIFKISNYFVLLFLIATMYAVYLSVRPELAKKELTGKSIKSLLVIILTLVYQFILTLLTMNLFNKLVKDDGTVMKYVLSMGFEYVLYLVVTFAFLIIISSILRILHKVIVTVCKNTNTVVKYLLFSVITLILFAGVIYFLPEIINLIEIGVNKLFTAIIK